MKFVRWLRFTWDLAKLPDTCEIDSHYRIRAATREDEETVRKVINRTFSLDTDWANTLKQVCDTLESQLDEVFRHREPPCLVVTHGARIIGASVLATADGCENNLLSGPCILIEYRSRGIGTALLHRSLVALRDAGLAHAYGVTKEGVPAAKFIYPKFHSVSVEHDFDPQLVG